MHGNVPGIQTWEEPTNSPGAVLGRSDGGHKVRVCYGSPFKTERGVTHREPVSPTIFNRVVDAIVWSMLLEGCGSQEALHGLVWAAGGQDIMFYSDGGRIVGGNPVWVQRTLTTIVRVSEQVGMYTNLGKTKDMTCTHRFIWGGVGKKSYKQQATGEGTSFW